MTVALANALRKGWFAYTNDQKGHNMARADRTERKVTSLCQDVSVIDDSIKVLKTTSRGSRAINTLTDAMKNTKSTSVLLDSVGFVAKWASKAVNPILCLAGAVRAWSRDDKVSGFIKETCALGLMFLFEGAIKKNFGLGGKAQTYKSNKYVKRMVDLAKEFSRSNKWLSKIPQNRLSAIGKAAIFVAGSCTGFGLGEKIGNFITKHTTEPIYRKNHPPKVNLENTPFEGFRALA